MVSDKEQLRREIRVVKEVIAQLEKQQEIGHSSYHEMEQDVTIPKHYKHLLNQQPQQVEEHLERLERDLDELTRYNGEFVDGFHDEKSENDGDENGS